MWILFNEQQEVIEKEIDSSGTDREARDQTLACLNYYSCPQNMSLRGDSKSPGASLKSCSKAAGPTPPKRRNSTLWSETLDVHQKSTFSTKEIKRQEVTYNCSIRYHHSSMTFIDNALCQA